ncbi:hypothetical protein NBRC116494_23640 [Aurantivibrio plasticivorans]
MIKLLHNVVFTLLALTCFSHIASAETSTPSNTTQASPFAHIPQDVPVVMLNMLKFSESAHYDDTKVNMTGRQAYDKYREGASKLVAKVGAKRLWIGNVKAGIISPSDEQWDEVFLVQYPSIGVFLKMVNSEAYKAVAIHRTAALDDSRLIAMIAK